MKRIQFDSSTSIHKVNLLPSIDKAQLIQECQKLIQSKPYVKLDGYTYKIETNNLNFTGIIPVKSKLDAILQKGIEQCCNLYAASGNYSYINLESWVNVVRSKNPSQDIINSRYHSHVEINSKRNAFRPTYTFVYYIQMPNNLSGDDGVLFLLGDNGTEYKILPQEGDLIIMNGEQLHGPNSAPNSTLDRYVLAGNIEFKIAKTKTSLL